MSMAPDGVVGTTLLTPSSFFLVHICTMTTTQELQVEPSYATLLHALQRSTPSTHAAKPPAKKRRRSTCTTQPPQSYYHQQVDSNAWEGDTGRNHGMATHLATPDNTTLLTNVDALPDMTVTDLKAYNIPQRLQTRWAAVTGRADLASPQEATAFALFNRYLDVCMTTSGDTTDALLLHIVTHCIRAADTIKKNNQAPEPRPRDQGFARTKALLLLPMRNVAALVVLRLASLAQRETRADSIQHKQRFVEEYGTHDEEAEDGDSPEARALRRKPADHRARFAGNTDDHFRLGIRITRGAVRLYAEFSESDIVIASPLGLVTMIEEQGPASMDWAASLDVIALLDTDVLLMQNWAHVRTVLAHVNRVPSAMPSNVDVMRVREAHLAGQAARVRQLILLGAFPSAECNALFHANASSVAGRVRLVPRFTDAVLRTVIPQLRQLFRRVADDEQRFLLFSQNLYPRMRESSAHGQLVVVPSYLDFVRLRRFLDDADAQWDAITEYTPPREAAQLRAHFSSGRQRLVLYTERAHFYHRYTLHGARDIVFYQLPCHAAYYAELLNMMALRDAGDEHGTVTVLFDGRDALQLERVVGTSRAKRMLAAVEQDTFMFV